MLNASLFYALSVVLILSNTLSISSTELIFTISPSIPSHLFLL